MPIDLLLLSEEIITEWTDEARGALGEFWGSSHDGCRSDFADGVVADALFDDYFLAYELRQRGIELVAHVQAEQGSVRSADAPAADAIIKEDYREAS
jgi:hypothetical protein